MEIGKWFGRRTAAVVASGAALLMSAGAWSQDNANVRVITKTLVGGSAHKECMALTPTQSLRYWYRAEGPLNFAIQYQDEKETYYPVRRDKVAIATGTFTPRIAQDYCMVFTNAAKKPVLFRVEFARLGK